MDNVDYVAYDALQKPNLEIAPDYIICGAGLASPELYTQKPVETILSNFDGLHNLLEFAKQNSVERLLYISSSEVYGKKDTRRSVRKGRY